MKKMYFTVTSAIVMKKIESEYRTKYSDDKSFVGFIYDTLSEYGNITSFNKGYQLLKAIKENNKQFVAEIILDFMEHTKNNMFEEVKKNKIIENIYCHTKADISTLKKVIIRLNNWYELNINRNEIENIANYGKYEISNYKIQIFKNKKITIQAL